MIEIIKEINTLDVIVIALLLLSSVLAFARGMVLEMLSLLGWLIAYFGARFITPLLKDGVVAFVGAYKSLADWIKSITDIENFVYVTLLLVLFILIAVAFYFINHWLVKFIRISRLNLVDRSLGFAFGLVRGALLVSIVYLMAMWVWESDKMPSWIKEAKTAALMERGALLVQGFIPNDLKPKSAVEKEKQEGEKRSNEKLTIKQVLVPKSANSD